MPKETDEQRMPEGPASVTIALCADLGREGKDPVLDRVRGELERSTPGVNTEVVPNLCKSPDQVPRLVLESGAKRLVLGLCASAGSAHEFQGRARKAGLDPYAIRLVSLKPWTRGNGSSEAGADLVLQLKASVARLRAFKGSEPEQLRMRLLDIEGKVSRRSLVVMPPWTYEAVPSIDLSSCLGQQRCGRCVSACPVEAIKEGDGALYVDKVQCEACGFCQATCPANAVQFPGSSFAEHEAELSSLLSEGAQRLLLTCRRAAVVAEETREDSELLLAGWLPVEVPCMGAVTPGWILQALSSGAQSVALLACGDNCRFGQKPVVHERVSYIHALLNQLGVDHPSERVKIVPAKPEKLARSLSDTPSLENLWHAGADGAKLGDLSLAEPGATVGAALKLAEAQGVLLEPADAKSPGADISLTHDASPLGLVRLREETCTTCGACVGACPTGALSMNAEGPILALTYDASRCIGCGSCVPVCPESEQRTITVNKTTDVAALKAGQVTLKQEKLARCKRCGHAIAPNTMLRKIESMLQDEEGAPALLKTVGELCDDCRAMTA